jgi:hypothetical protein
MAGITIARSSFSTATRIDEVQRHRNLQPTWSHRCLTSRYALPSALAVSFKDQSTTETSAVTSFSSTDTTQCPSDRWLVVLSSAMLDAHQPTNPPKMSGQGRQGRAQFDWELQVLEPNSCHFIKNSAEDWYDSDHVCDGWASASQSPRPPLQVTGHDRACIARHAWATCNVYAYAWTYSEPTVLDQAAMWACPRYLMWCVPWPN